MAQSLNERIAYAIVYVSAATSRAGIAAIPNTELIGRSTWE